MTVAVERIRNIARKRGAPIGYTLVEAVGGDTEEKQGISKRTEQRLLRKTGNEVLGELNGVSISSMSLPRPDNPIYEADELLVLEAIAAINRAAANNRGIQLGDERNPDSDPDNLFYEDGPSGETLLEAIKEMSVDEIADVMNFALRKTYTWAKPRSRNLSTTTAHGSVSEPKL